MHETRQEGDCLATPSYWTFSCFNWFCQFSQHFWPVMEYDPNSTGGLYEHRQQKNIQVYDFRLLFYSSDNWIQNKTNRSSSALFTWNTEESRGRWKPKSRSIDHIAALSYFFLKATEMFSQRYYFSFFFQIPRNCPHLTLAPVPTCFFTLGILILSLRKILKTYIHSFIKYT